MLFSEDDPQPLLPAATPAVSPSPARLSEGQADACNLWAAGELAEEQEVYSETCRNAGQEHFRQSLFCEI